MDPDDFSNSTKFSDEVYSHHMDLYERLLLELFTLVGLISTATNCLIIFVILKYKKLRQEVTNMIVVHLNILQILFFLATPATWRVMKLLHFFDFVSRLVFCVIQEIECTFLFAICLFFILLVCDWYLQLYRESAYSKFCRIYKFFVFGIYICSVALCSSTVQFCHRYLTNNVILVLLIAAILLLLLVIVMNVIHACKKGKLRPNNKNNVGLVIVNTFFLLWCPALLTMILSFFVSFHFFIFFITIALGLSNPIFNFLYFFFYDTRFNVFIKKVFKCQCNDYENDELEDQAVTYNDENGVQITRNEQNVYA